MITEFQRKVVVQNHPFGFENRLLNKDDEKYNKNSKVN